METEIDELVRRFCGGERKAAEEIIGLHYERIYAFLRRLCGNDPDASDLTQQTFCRLWKSAATFAGKSSFSSWLHGIAWHVYADWGRRNERSFSPTAEWWLEQPSLDPGPDRLAASSDLSRTVFGSVDRLERDLRETVHLHYYQGLTLQETADAMNVATSTVKYRLRSALDELRKAISDPPRNEVTRITAAL